MEENLFLCFVNKVGKDIDGFYTYEFLFSTEEQLDNCWGRDWNYRPSGICGEIPPEESTYERVKKLRTNILFDVAQENMCFSMQDCINGVIAVCYENLDDPDMEYPEEGVLVFRFGESIKDVEYKLAKRNLIMGWV